MSVPQSPPGSGPTIEAVHRDILLANQYRIELIKYLLATAVALLAFTVTFRPSLVHVDAAWAMYLGWIALTTSIAGAIVHMIGWEHYYKSYRDYDWKLKATPDGKVQGKLARKRINRWRLMATLMQFVGFAAGVAGITWFAVANLDNVRKPDEPSSAGRQACVMQVPTCPVAGAMKEAK